MAAVSYNIPEDLPDACQIMEAAQEMAAILDVTEREEAILTVFRLLDGVLGAPEDIKKRRVRRANEAFQRKVGRHTCAISFLLGVGFVETEDPDSPGVAVLSMPVAYLARLTDAHHSLAIAAKEVGIVAPALPSTSFNPYRSDLQKTDALKSSVAAEAWRDKAERLHNEVKELQQEIQHKVEAVPSVDLRPVAFWLSSGRRLEDVMLETAEHIEDPSSDKALLMQVASTKQGTSGGNATFESADKRRLVELSRSRVHATCTLRVICPDKSVLQANFRAGDTGEHVIAKIGPLLSPHVRQASWYIYQSPPLKRLAPKETLHSAGLTPGANMYLGFETLKPAAPYLSASVAAQLGPSPYGYNSSEATDHESLVAGGAEVTNWGEGKKLEGNTPSCDAKATSAKRSTSFKLGDQSSSSASVNPRWFKGTAPAVMVGKDEDAHSAAFKRKPSDSSTCTGGPSSPGADLEPALQDEQVSPLGLFSCMSSWCNVSKAKS